MTAEDFVELEHRLGLSRAEFCRKLGIAPNSGTAYALGRKPIPRTVALACIALALENAPPWPLDPPRPDRPDRTPKN